MRAYPAEVSDAHYYYKDGKLLTSLRTGQHLPAGARQGGLEFRPGDPAPAVPRPAGADLRWSPSRPST